MNLQELIPQLGQQAVNDISDLITALRSSANDEIKEQADEVQGYVTQYATHAIDKPTFDLYVRGSERVLRSKLDDMKVEVRAATEKLAADMERILVQSLILLV